MSPGSAARRTVEGNDGVLDASDHRRIAIVDDDPGVLRSVARLLSCHGYDAHTFTSPHALLGNIEKLDVCCVIADLAMPECNGLELQERLAKARVALPIVFVTGRGDIRSSVAAMRGGAVDFLAKPFEHQELLDAVERALTLYEEYRGLHERRARYQRRLASLTRREREVFREVVEGRLNKQIASKLGITEKTVKVHRARVMRKMAVRSVAQLARVAEQLSLDESAN